jgi:alpha-L-fucosidase
MKRISILVFFSLIYISTFSQTQTNERAKWFTDSRFGMFIHWGVYSGAEGYWKGEKLRNDNNYAEWIYYRNRIEKEEYLTLLDRFAWDEIKPEEWVILAKKSGMKYITLTAKHHDGFGLWDSKVSSYDLGDYTNPKRDVVKELAEACKKHGLKLGLYYSHWVDWEHEHGWDHNKELTGISPEQYDKYWQEKVIPQMRELLTNYGEISIFWFDMWIHHSKTVVTKEQLLQLKGLIRELQPNCLVNSRLGLSIEEDPDIDFKTLGDNSLGNRKEEFPWQSPATVAHSWGFHATDSEWKSTTSLLKALINNVSLNGNLMLNIGPRANGDVPYEIEQRLLEMGQWLEVNGESVYGARAFDLPKNQHDWGRITCKKIETGTTVYLHVFNWPLNNELYLTGIKTKPEKIYFLADEQKSPLKFDHSEVLTTIQLAKLQPDPYVSVIVLDFNQDPEVESGLAGKTSDGGISLTLQNVYQGNENLSITKKDRGGTVPEYVSIKENKTLKWEIYVDKPGEKSIDISYSFQQNPENSLIKVKAANKELMHNVSNTGKTIGEPNENWVIDNFKSNRIGKIFFPKKGIYTIEIEFQPGNNNEIKFQWGWLF